MHNWTPHKQFFPLPIRIRGLPVRVQGPGFDLIGEMAGVTHFLGKRLFAHAEKMSPVMNPHVCGNQYDRKKKPLGDTYHVILSIKSQYAYGGLVLGLAGALFYGTVLFKKS